MTPFEKVDFDKILDRYNFGMRYSTTLLTLTVSEMYELLDKMNAKLRKDPVEGKKELTVDQLAFIILSSGVHPLYNKINRSYEEMLTSIEFWVDVTDAVNSL